jgi:hypothetical protein
MSEVQTGIPETTAKEPTSSEVPLGINPAVAKEEAREGQATKEKEAIKKFMKKIKVRDKEVELDEDQLTSYAQKGFDAQEKWESAAKMRKDAEHFISKLKSDPLSVLTDPRIGVNFRKIAEDYIWDQMQEEKLSPEEKERRQEKRELEEYRQKEKHRREREESQRDEELRTNMRADYDRKIAEALSKSGLPRTKHTIEKFTKYMARDVKNGVQREMEDYIDVVRQDYIEDMQHFFGESPADTLIKFIGENNMKKIREHDLSKMKSPTPKENHTFVPGKGMVKVEHKRMRGVDWESKLTKEFLGR